MMIVLMHDYVREAKFTTKPRFEAEACFKRRATAVLSWLDFSTTLTRLYHDLVQRSNLTQSNKVALAETKLKNKKRFSELLKCILMYL